jgi:hypothetical protein
VTLTDRRERSEDNHSAGLLYLVGAVTMIGVVLLSVVGPPRLPTGLPQLPTGVELELLVRTSARRSSRSAKHRLYAGPSFARTEAADGTAWMRVLVQIVPGQMLRLFLPRYRGRCNVSCARQEPVVEMVPPVVARPNACVS